MTKVCPLMSTLKVPDHHPHDPRLYKQRCIENECALWSIALNGCSLNNGVVKIVSPNPTETYKT